MNLAKKFQPTYIINSSFREGSYRKEAFKSKKPILVFEGGESSSFHYQYINEAVNGTLRLMKYLKMVDVEVRENTTAFINKSTWIRARSSGMFHCTKTNGVPITKGEVIGEITDPFGEHKEKIVAPQNGFIIAINTHPVINQGDALMHLGFE